MLHRIISSRTFTTSLLLVSLFGLAAPACDGGDDSCGDDGADGGGDDGADGGGNDGGGDGVDDGVDDGGGDGVDDGGGDGVDDGGGDGVDDGGGDGVDDGGGDGSGGDVGEQCQDNVDCASGSCIFAGDVDFGICTVLCEDFTDCPDFWSCEEIGNATGTYCVPD